MEWKNCKIEDAPIAIIDGDRGKNYPKQGDFLNIGHCLFLNASNVTKKGFDFNNCQFISEDKDEKLRKGKLFQHDIVMTTRGTLGNVAYYHEKIGYEHIRINSGMVIFRCDRNKLLPNFFYLFICSPLFINQVNSLRSGVAQPQLPIKDIKTIKIKIPPLPIQQKIADILSKYDDLIENNRRRIELLERSARLLYKEWFVRLRFPGHEHTPIIDGIPEGWEKGQVSDFYKTASGGTPSRKNPDFFTGDINWVKTQELNNSFIFKTDEKITEEAIKNSSAKIFPAHTVLVAMYGATIGQTAILANSATTNQACCGLLPDCHIANYIHCFLFFRENKQILANLSLGAAQNNISQEIIRNFPMLLPSKKVMDIFWEFTNRIFEQIKILEQQNQKLKQARDILLPKLMNGEIEV
jgi:type I restriction enzyme S subunit